MHTWPSCSVALSLINVSGQWPLEAAFTDADEKTEARVLLDTLRQMRESLDANPSATEDAEPAVDAGRVAGPD